VEVRFSAPVQNGSGAYTMGTGSFPGVKPLGHGVYHAPPSTAEVKERVELYLYFTSRPSWPVITRTLPLPLLFISSGSSLNSVYTTQVFEKPGN